MDKCDKYDIQILANLKLFRPTSGALCREQMKTNFNRETFSRKNSQNIDSQINDTWEEKTSQNPRLFNGSKFRLSRWYISEENWILDIGLTNYKDLWGTDLSPNRQAIQEKGLVDFEDSQAYMSNAMGVGILIKTSDDHLIVIRRASWTGEFPGMLDRPGGHPEPDLVLTQDGKLKPEVQSRCGDINEAVMNEIWNSAEQEAEDELGLSKDKLQDMVLLGFTSHLINGGRPSLEFFARLNMKAEEVREVYNLGKHTEADENTSLHLIPISTMSAILPMLLQKENIDCTSSETLKREIVKDHQELGSTSNVDLESMVKLNPEAKALFEEASPYLKAILALAHAQNLI